MHVCMCVCMYDRVSIPKKGREGFFPLTSASRPALWPTQPPVQCVPGLFPRGKALPGSDAEGSPRSRAEVKKE
jgi:hypothetical protein